MVVAPVLIIIILLVMNLLGVAPVVLGDQLMAVFLNQVQHQVAVVLRPTATLLVEQAALAE
jgi:hypothetical protein